MASSEITPTARLVPHEKGFALILDPELLRQLGLDENTPLAVTINGKSLRVTAEADDLERQRKFEAAKADTFQKYDDVLRRLAK